MEKERNKKIQSVVFTKYKKDDEILEDDKWETCETYHNVMR